MAIIKTQKRENPYVQIDKRVLNDSRLSWKSKGILAYLLSKPDDWQVITEDILKQSPDGREAVRAAFKELREFGYAELVSVKEEGTGKMLGQTWLIKESPSVPNTETRETRRSENPTLGKSPTTNNDSYKEGLSTKNEKPLKAPKKERQRMQIPTLGEVQAKANEIKLSSLEAEKFFNYHTAKGWVMGRSPMKDWHAALRTWKLNGEQFAKDRQPAVGLAPKPMMPLSEKIK